MIASALVTLIVVLAVVWVAGSAIAPRAPASERLAFGVLGAIAMAWATMLQGPAGVGLLGRPWALRAIAIALLAGLLAWRRPSLRPWPISWTPVAVAAASTALVTFPGFLVATPRLWPSHADMLWHQGWIRQLAAGVAAPAGVYAGEPNSYPWLYHSIAAWLMAALPGDLNAALLAADVAGVAAGWLGMWLLARELGARPAAATWGAALFTVAAGFGWIWQHTPAALMHQNGANLGPYHGDLVLFNVFLPSLGDVPPLIPRELAACLAPLALWLAVRGLGRGPATLLWAAGAAIGFVFLIGPLPGVFCAVWTGVLAIRARTAAAWRTAVAAAAVAAVWVVPLGLAYHRYGGFVSITHITPVNPSLAQTAVALGILLPLGVAGAVGVAARPRDVARGPIVLLLAVPAAACAAGALVGHDGSVFGTPALLRWARYLPMLALALAPPAGIAADRLVRLAGARLRLGGVAVAAGLAAVAVPSTVLATVAVVHHAYPVAFACTAPPAASALTAVAIRQPIADDVAMELFASTAAPSVFLKIAHSKVRFRTWLERPPTQPQRKAWARALLLHGVVPPGVSWVVAGGAAAPVQGAGFVRAGTCRLGSRTYTVLRRP